MAAGVFERRNCDEQTPHECVYVDEIKAKIQESNFIFTALPLIETSLSFSMYCIVTPNSTCPDDTTLNLISPAISATNITVLFNTQSKRSNSP